jgi:hypothetical protein
LHWKRTWTVAKGLHRDLLPGPWSVLLFASYKKGIGKENKRARYIYVRTYIKRLTSFWYCCKNSWKEKGKLFAELTEEILAVEISRVTAHGR